MRKEVKPRRIKVHGYMIYRCEKCRSAFYMYLEEGVEDFGNTAFPHQPSPFVIVCPYCGDMSRDVSGIQKTEQRFNLHAGEFYFRRDDKGEQAIPTHYTPQIE